MYKQIFKLGIEGYLNKLVRHKRRDKLDLLVHGNPQLMHERITSIEEVEEYFSRKLESINT